MPKITAVDSEKPLKCVARRHMRPAMFMTYDAILAMCKSDEDYRAGDELIFWASEAKLGNLNNRSKQQESEALKALEKDGWIVHVDAKQGRYRAGRFTTKKYRVVEHDEYVKTHICPPPLYSESGDKLERGELSTGLARHNAKKLLKFLPDAWLKVVLQGISEKDAGTDTGNPVTVATFPEITADEVLAERRKQR